MLPFSSSSDRTGVLFLGSLRYYRWFFMVFLTLPKNEIGIEAHA
jgi:hypothetical protein